MKTKWLLMIWLLLCALAFALSASSVRAQCAQWDVSGQWELQQSNGFTVQVDLHQNGKTVTGTASFTYVKPAGGVLGAFQGGDPATQRGSFSGNISGDDFYGQIGWTSGSVGIYRGKVGAQGRIDGTMYDKGAPSSRATWFSGEFMKCAGAPAANVPAPGVNPIRKTGKAKLATPAPTVNPIRKTGKARPGNPVTPDAAPQAENSSGAPRIGAMPQVVRIPAGQTQGTANLAWDGGKDHPYAEVWVKVDGEDSKFVVEQGKGAKVVKVEAGKTYQYILTDSGQQLATVTVQAK